MKIIITGALGHIGSALIRYLAKQSKISQVILIDNLSTQRYSSLFNLPESIPFSFIEEDIVNLDWNNLLKDIDALVHLAAITDAAGTLDQPERIYKNNFEATKIVADACLAMNVPIIFPSSTSVYGSQQSVVDELCEELLPQSPYAECKLKEESYLKQLFKQGLKGIILRLGTIYGISPGMRFHTAVNKFCWQAVMKQPLTVWQTALHQKRPYLALSDCCAAISWILEKKCLDGQTYNIVSHNFTVQDVINEIQKHISDLKINLVNHKIMNQLSYEVLAEKITALGFRFSGDFYTAITDTVHLLKGANR